MCGATWQEYVHKCGDLGYDTATAKAQKEVENQMGGSMETNTADVEKIAIKTRNRIVAYLLDRVKDPLRRYEEEQIRELISMALAQAHAPLVALAQEWERRAQSYRDAPDNVKNGYIRGQIVATNAHADELRAALTGTDPK